MFCVIINQDTGEVIESGEVERSEMRPRLMELREASDTKYSMMHGETVEAAIAAAKAQAAQNREYLIKREEAIAALPPVSGPTELSKEQWDQAMTKLGIRNRHHAANLAAHSWAVMEHEDGLVLIGHVDHAVLLSGDQETPTDVPRICHTCKFGRTHITSREENRIGLMPCSIGRPYLRKVHRTQVCSGWTKI